MSMRFFFAVKLVAKQIMYSLICRIDVFCELLDYDPA